MSRLPGPETIPSYWHPSRPDARRLDGPFAAKVAEISKDLAVTWNPILERWQVFARAPRMQHPICSGWRLLFIHHDGEKGYAAPDERLLARLIMIDGEKQGIASKYFDRIMSERKREKEKRDRADRQDEVDRAMPAFEHSQISVSMCGKSNGSKFTKYHS